MNLLELQNKIHKQNVELGWWDEPRPFSTFVCLFHSELSEAMEGDRKGLMDDHLPQYPMFQVELADFVIRCLDWLEFMKKNGIEPKRTTISKFNNNWNNTAFLACLHGAVSEAYLMFDYESKTHATLATDEIKSAIEISFSAADVMGFDLEKIILEKVEYNKHRADHKRENRAKAGGKKY